MDRDEIIKSINMKRPFIYQTTSMGYKYVGMAVFRDCTEEEKTLFEKYWKEINRIHFLTYTPDEREVGKLVETFSQILKFGDCEHTSERYERSSEEIENAINVIDEEELKSLDNQIKLFIEAFDYKDGAFYRHDRKLCSGEEDIGH